MLSYASGKVKFQDACDTVLELVEGISAIPVSFIRSMSLAMVQELSGFGHLLSSFIGKDLSISEYRHLSTVMLCMSELLECLTSSISAAHEAAEKLKRYVDRIESHITMIKSSPKPSAPLMDLDQNVVPSTIEMAFPLDLFEQMEWAGLFTQSMDQQYVNKFNFHFGATNFCLDCLTRHSHHFLLFSAPCIVFPSRHDRIFIWILFTHAS